jgi:hypothetical protein
VDFLVDVGEGDAGEFGFHAGLGFGEDGVDDRLDLRANGAFLVGYKGAATVIFWGGDGAVDVAQRDILRCVREGETAGRASL